jgi:hypothetical protein
MSSSAITAQGSTLQINSTTGAAKTISAVTVGNPTILTITANGLTKGDLGTIAGLTGADAALLNGQQLVAKYVTTNTIAVDVDTTGKTITAGAGTYTPVQWATIANVKSFSGVDGKTAEMDVSNLASSAVEVIMGLTDSGNFSFDFDRDNSDNGQTKCLLANAGSLLKTFKLTTPDAHTATFSGYVTQWPMSGGVNQTVKGTGAIRITGAVTYA